MTDPDPQPEAEAERTAEFDPEKFEEKYVHYFDELEEAYSNAYQQLHGQVDSEVLRAIDRQVLSESEPVYEGSGEFSVALPENPRERVGAVDDEEFEAVLSAFTERIERELQRLFEFGDWTAE
ncbi:DUF5783 family protein [Natrialba sp. PRR66]|uniref:DUF5783 family protein n=1 Tax=Natrialba sp. PRR66 TaxID=3098146 RepID=UPI002B1D706A|nr:DUF5783 family protein [Natrialba sp. PRR66]